MPKTIKEYRAEIACLKDSLRKWKIRGLLRDMPYDKLYPDDSEFLSSLQNYPANCTCCGYVFGQKFPKHTYWNDDINQCIKECPILWPWNDMSDEAWGIHEYYGYLCHQYFVIGNVSAIIQTIKDSITIKEWYLKRLENEQ